MEFLGSDTKKTQNDNRIDTYKYGTVHVHARVSVTIEYITLVLGHTTVYSSDVQSYTHTPSETSLIAL